MKTWSERAVLRAILYVATLWALVVTVVGKSDGEWATFKATAIVALFVGVGCLAISAPGNPPGKP